MTNPRYARGPSRVCPKPHTREILGCTQHRDRGAARTKPSARQRARNRESNRRCEQRRRAAGKVPAWTPEQRQRYREQEKKHRATQSAASHARAANQRAEWEGNYPGLTVVTAQTLRRPTFKVITPQGVRFETLTPDLL